MPRLRCWLKQALARSKWMGELCHEMRIFNASTGELSAVLRVYPGVERLYLDDSETQPHVE